VTTEQFDGHRFFGFLKKKSVVYLTIGSLFFNIGTGIVDKWTEEYDAEIFSKDRAVAMEVEKDLGDLSEGREYIAIDNKIVDFLRNYSNIFPEFETRELHLLYNSVEELHPVLDENGAPRNAIDVVVNYFEEFKDLSDKYDVPVPIPIGVLMIESGGKFDETSFAGNRGLFQLSSNLARHYGLEVNEWRDERTDPIKSADAGINYLSDLYNRFGQWGLSILGYHQGETRIGNMVSDYLEQNHGVTKSGGRINHEVIDKYDVNLYSILEDDEVSNKYFSNGYALTGKSYVQKIVTSMEIFNNYLDEVEEVEIDDVYTVEQGDSLNSIASRYNKTLEDLLDSNSDIQNADVLEVGQEIRIPGSYMDINDIREAYREGYSL